MARSLPEITRRTALAALVQPILSAGPSFPMPRGACDCHTHIIGDPQRFPFAKERVYTPPPASPSEMAALHRTLHIDRVVIVTPSVYGSDNSATLYGIKARGETARGVAVIDETSDLHRLAGGAIRGIRLNLATGGQAEAVVARKRIAEAIKRVRPLGWHLQI